jgi:hypothetical protein
VIPVYIGYCAVFKVREEQGGYAGTHRATRVLCKAGVCRSLKTQQHAATLARTARVRRRGLPGPVDMLGPVRSELGVDQTQWPDRVRTQGPHGRLQHPAPSLKRAP